MVAEQEEEEATRDWDCRRGRRREGRCRRQRRRRSPAPSLPLLRRGGGGLLFLVLLVLPGILLVSGQSRGAEMSLLTHYARGCFNFSH